MWFDHPDRFKGDQMNKRATAGLSAGVLIVAGLLAGCSDDGDGDAAGDDKAAAEFADQTYDEIKQAAIDAMGDLTSVHVEAEISSEGQGATLDLSMDADGNCAGTVSFGDVSAEVLQADGGAWFKPNAELLIQQFGEEQGPDAIEFVADSWVADTNGQVTPNNCDLAGFIEQVTSDEEEETNTEVGDLEELDGADVVTLTFSNEDGDGIVKILATGDHYIATFAVDGANPGEVTFSEFDEKVETEAPADDEIVDLADFSG